MKNEKFLSEFGRDYLFLGLRIGKLIEGYVDAYYGPQELKEKVDHEDKKSPKNYGCYLPGWASIFISHTNAN